MPGFNTEESKARLISILESKDAEAIKDSFSDFIYTVVYLANTKDNRDFVSQCLNMSDKYYPISSQFFLRCFLKNKFPELDCAQQNIVRTYGSNNFHPTRITTKLESWAEEHLHDEFTAAATILQFCKLVKARAQDSSTHADALTEMYADALHVSEHLDNPKEYWRVAARANMLDMKYSSEFSNHSNNYKTTATIRNSNNSSNNLSSQSSSAPSSQTSASLKPLKVEIPVSKNLNEKNSPFDDNDSPYQTISDPSSPFFGSDSPNSTKLNDLASADNSFDYFTSTQRMGFFYDNSKIEIPKKSSNNTSNGPS